jgi:hypothetical protein
VSGVSADIHLTNYGAFAEYYVGRLVTLGVKGGGLSGSLDLSATGLGSGSANSNGDYASGAITVYPFANLAFTGEYDYGHINRLGNENSWSADVEWMFSESVPVSIYAGYENTKLGSGGPTTDTWLVGVKFYTDTQGPAPLETRQRGGAAAWGTSFGIPGLASAL